jgi:hypothetical protein
MRRTGPDDPELARFLREELGEGPLTTRPWDVRAPLWQWRGKAKDGTPSSMAWFFITIGADVSEEIRAASAGRTAAWGSIYVTATIGATQWRTSLFPSKEAGGYLLPVKATVRKAEKLQAGDEATIRLML